MYTYCRIMFVDDESELDVIIKASEEYDIDYEDDMIFFYGLSRDEIIDAYTKGDVIEGEWKIINVGDTCDVL